MHDLHRGPSECGFCDKALTRCAALVIRLRRTSQLLHSALKHPADWPKCNEDVCRAVHDEIANADPAGTGRR
jgi:hypothetical protein